MSSPGRHAQRQSQFVNHDNALHSASGESLSPNMPRTNSRFAASRAANTQPTYDFLAGNSISSNSHRVQPLQQSVRPSQATKADVGNEDLRAQINTLLYEIESFKQEREYTNLRHEKELRDAQAKADADFKRAQFSESSKHVASHKYEALAKELEEVRNQAANQRGHSDKKLRTLQEENRSLREDVEEAQREASSLDRQYKYQLQEIESKHATLETTVKDLRADLENKSSVLRITQERLSQRETEVGHLESEVLRLKAQTGDTETLAVIKRELSDQVTHIRKLEGTNREQTAELRHYRRIHKAVEIVEEEKRVLESKLGLMEDLQHELREAQLRRQILEDEKKTWTSYLENEGGLAGDVELNSPEDLVKALMQQRVENAALVERIGRIQPEVSEKDELIKSLEDERDAFKTEMEKARAKVGADNRSARLERQRALAVKEVEFLREQLKTFDVEDKVDEQNLKRIEELESLIDEYRAEVKQLSEQISIKEENPQARDLQPSKRPREDEPDERLGQLSRKNRKLQDTLSSLQQSYSLLESNHTAATLQLASLQKSAQTRILALRDNPTAAVETIKMSSLASLRAENAALLTQLEHPARKPPTETVPISTLENARADYQALQAVVADRDKTILRIKQVYTKVASELRAAVANLLGWDMSPMANNRIRMTSMLHPGRRSKSKSKSKSKPKSSNTGAGGRDDDDDDDDDDDQNANSLIFDGALGQFQISGGPDGEFGREIRALVQFWVNERGSIPLFLAAATMEFYDQSTKAARALNVVPGGVGAGAGAGGEGGGGGAMGMGMGAAGR